MCSVKQQKCQGTEKTEVSSQVPHKLGEIDKGFHGEGCADRKTCCRGPMYELRN